MWQHGSVPSAPPPGDPAPADGRLPEQALAQLGEQPFGLYVHVPFCRSGAATATSTPTPPRSSGPARPGRRTPSRRSRRSGWPAGCSATSTCRSRRSSSAAGRPTLLPPGRPRRGAGRRRRGVRAGRRRRGHHRGQPRLGDPVGPRGAPRGRLQPDLLRHAVGGRRTCWPRWTAPTTRCGCPAVVEWARAAGLRAGQPGPDLRHAGGVAADWETSLDAALACEPDHVSAYSLIVEDGTALARAGAPRRAAGARRRRPRRQVPRSPTSGSRPPGSRWYEVSNWARDPAARGGPVPAQPPLLDRGGLVGRRARGPLPRRRRPLVERQAPRGVRRPAGAAATSPAHAREMLDAEERRVERVLLEIRLRDGLDPARARRRRPGGGAGAGRAGAARGRDGRRWCSRRDGRLLADAVVRDLLP